jgi:hypothetical protein
VSSDPAAAKPAEPEPAREANPQEVGVAELFGGPRGLVDAGVPGAVFAVAYAVTGSDLELSVWIALGCGIALAGLSLIQRRPVQQAIAGLIGVALMAFIASRTGRAEDFFLPSLIKNAAYGGAYAISALVRWPLLGVFLGPVLGEGFAWRKDPVRLRAYTLVTWLWAGMFALRLAVQIPLYLAGAVTALGFAGIPLGLPLFALTGWLTYQVLRKAPRTVPPEQADDAEPDTAKTDP